MDLAEVATMTNRRAPSRPRRLAQLATICLAGCFALECRAQKTKQKDPTAKPPASSLTPSAPERPPMYVSHPLLNLKVDIDDCAFQLFVNGGLVTSNLRGTAHEEQPLNHWVRTGANDIQLYMYKPADEQDTCDVKLALTVTDNDDDRIPPVTVFVLAHSAKAAAAGTPTLGTSPSGTFDSHLAFRTSDKGDVRIGPAKIAQLKGEGSQIHVLSRSFDVQMPFPEWAFFRGDKLRQWFEFDSSEARRAANQEILGAYRKVWSFLQKKDVNGFLDACEERSHETDLAFYKGPGETRAALRKSLESAIEDPEFELAPVEPSPGKTWKYTVGSTGKLIALTRGDRGSPIFRYQMKNGTPFSLIFPVVFRKQGNQYVVTR
jgi:hypothetical protein